MFKLLVEKKQVSMDTLLKIEEGLTDSIVVDIEWDDFEEALGFAGEFLADSRMDTHPYIKLANSDEVNELLVECYKQGIVRDGEIMG